MFSSVLSDTTLPYLRCRQVSVVGNSVHALRKNYVILGLISSASNNDFTYEDEEDDGLVVVVDRDRRSYRSNTSSSNGLIEFGSHQDLRLVRRIGEGPRRKGSRVEMWSMVLSGSHRNLVNLGIKNPIFSLYLAYDIMATMVHEGSYFDEAQFHSKMKELSKKSSNKRRYTKTSVYVENLTEESVSSIKDVTKILKKEEESRMDERLTYNCKCSFLRIYNEQIADLLDPSSTNLQLREDVKKGVYVENLTECEVHTVGDILRLLSRGSANRRVSATNMNRESSRSHSVFTCVIESRWEKDSTFNLRFARLNLVDLAGSESHVIMVLVDGANARTRHVPYRDSRLTFLLQEELAILKRNNTSRSLAFGPKVIEEATQEHENDCNGHDNKILKVSSKQLKSLETSLTGALRREQMSEASIKQLEAEIEQLNRLVRQREDDNKCTKMMLKFREDKIHDQIQNELGFKSSKLDRTPTKVNASKHSESGMPMKTPEKQGDLARKRYGWGSGSRMEGKSGTMNMNMNTNTPRSCRTVGRTLSSGYSECNSTQNTQSNSTQNTPTKSVNKPPNPGLPQGGSSRPPISGGVRGNGSFAVLSRGLQNTYTTVNTVEVPHIDLKEDPSFWMDHNVQVLIRIRPLNNMELSAQGYNRCLQQESAQCLTWVGHPETRFTFDHVACETIDQTGSGKTHTMLGEINELELKPTPQRGMTPHGADSFGDNKIL
ncbi:unnamed protein product [Lactuca saligna]|uniref:Kinesin-like protein n=1 Tax=Lactuca saligna TaxID=75948 RepID=A0AA35YWV3_LACSI|nr:unnamed protein product [Lactuca saligna]